ATVVVVVGDQRLAFAETEAECAARAPRATGVEAFVEVEAGLVGAVGDGPVAGKAQLSFRAEGAQPQDEAIVVRLRVGGKGGRGGDGDGGIQRCKAQDVRSWHGIFLGEGWPMFRKPRSRVREPAAGGCDAGRSCGCPRKRKSPSDGRGSGAIWVLDRRGSAPDRARRVGQAFAAEVPAGRRDWWRLSLNLHHCYNSGAKQDRFGQVRRHAPLPTQTSGILKCSRS